MHAHTLLQGAVGAPKSQPTRTGEAYEGGGPAQHTHTDTQCCLGGPIDTQMNGAALSHTRHLTTLTCPPRPPLTPQPTRATVGGTNSPAPRNSLVRKASKPHSHTHSS